MVRLFRVRADPLSGRGLEPHAGLCHGGLPAVFLLGHIDSNVSWQAPGQSHIRLPGPRPCLYTRYSKVLLSS